MTRPGPAKLAFNNLSPAGKSQRKDPTAHRKYNRKRNKEPGMSDYRSAHNKERRKNGMGKAGKTGPVLARQPNGTLKPGGRKKNSDTSSLKIRKA